MRNFWRSFDLLLINCEIKKISRTVTVDTNQNAVLPTAADPATSTTGAGFQINSTKLYVLVITLSIIDNIKFLENMKEGFIKNNLDSMIDLTFRNINRLFVLLFKAGENDPTNRRNQN